MDQLDALADIDDKITGTDQEDLDTIEKLIENRTTLLELPVPSPKVEEPPPAEPQIEPPKDDSGDLLDDLRGLDAKAIDKKMNMGDMRDLIEQVTGERPPTRIDGKRVKSIQLAEMLEDLVDG